jgi:hypothetical protein
MKRRPQFHRIQGFLLKLASIDKSREHLVKRENNPLHPVITRKVDETPEGQLEQARLLTPGHGVNKSVLLSKDERLHESHVAVMARPTHAKPVAVEVHAIATDIQLVDVGAHHPRLLARLVLEARVPVTAISSSERLESGAGHVRVDSFPTCLETRL